jgi:WD40 repeat protein
MEPPENAPPDLIAVWETATGTLLRTVEYQSSALSEALAPDGRMLAVGDAQGTVTVWTLPDGAPYATLSTSNNQIQCLAFGREPRVSFRQDPSTPRWQLAAGDGGGTVTLFDLQNRRIRNIGRGSNNDIKALAFRPDGAVLVSLGRRLATLRDVATGRTILSVLAGNTHLAVAFAPDGRRMAVGHMAAFADTDGVRVFDLREGQSMQSLLGLETMVARIVFSSDGRLVAALAHDWQAGIWDRASGQLLHLIVLRPGLFVDNAWLAFDPTGRRIAFSAHEHATLWDLETGRLIQSWKLPPGLQDKLAFHGPDQLFLFRCETRDRVPPVSEYHPKDHPRLYRLYNLLGPPPLRPINEILDHDWHCYGIVMPANCGFVVADGVGVKDGRKARTIIAYDARTGATLWSMRSHRDIVDLGGGFDIDPSGTTLFLYNPRGQRTTWLKLPGREFIAETESTAPVLSPDGKRWFSNAPNRVTRRNEWQYYPDGARGPAIAIAEQVDTSGFPVFGPDSRHVACDGAKHDVVVCDLVELQRAMAEFGLRW